MNDFGQSLVKFGSVVSEISLRKKKITTYQYKVLTRELIIKASKKYDIKCIHDVFFFFEVFQYFFHLMK
jgi:hypothetical protein